MPKFRKNPSPIMSKRSPARQEVDPPVDIAQDPWQDINRYKQLQERKVAEQREGLRGKKAEGTLIIEKKMEGMNQVFDAIQSGANKEQVTQIVRDHNRSLYGKLGDLIRTKVDKGANAKISLNEAFDYMPKDKKPVENIKTDDKPTMMVGGAVKPGTIEEATRRFGSAVAPLDDPAKQAARDKFYEDNRIGTTTTTYLSDVGIVPKAAYGNIDQGGGVQTYKEYAKEIDETPIQRKGFKMPGFGRKK